MRVFLFIVLLSVCVGYGQKISFEIENDSINKKLYFTKVSDEVVEKIIIKDLNFDVKGLNLEEGYYLLKKEDKSALLYLKRSDELTISYDANDFYNTLSFRGKGSERNVYLYNRYVGKNNKTTTFYEREFYEGTENEYLDKVDKLYKGLFGSLLSSLLDQDFKNDELKNLQYGYSLDLLKFDVAKKHYQINDSIYASKYFLEPLTHTHFDNALHYDKYYSYKYLSVLKRKQDLEGMETYRLKQEVLTSIKTEGLRQGVLESLYDDMSRDKPELTKNYYNLIKNNSKSLELITKAKEKYAEIRQVEAEKNLSKFEFKNLKDESVQLSQFKGSYLFLYVWTKQCASCLGDVGVLNKLRKKYEDTNIKFLSVFINKKEDYEPWVNTLKEDNINNDYELFFTGTKVKFIKEYDISAIPDYILLSLKGNKMDVDIKDLDSKETKKILNALPEDE